MKDTTRQNKDQRQVKIQVGPIELEGILAIPENACGVVLFAHGSGSSRFSPRNRQVARTLGDSGIGTLLMDLLTAQEEAVDFQTRHLRFDIELLAGRVTGAAQWLRNEETTRSFPIGYFGSSTGAAAALVAAARHAEGVAAVVSRGGRPDLADDALAEVCAATLLIVGGLDAMVIAMNRQAMARMQCQKTLVIILGATHLFEEPGKLEEVAELTADWFKRCFSQARSAKTA